MLAAGLLAATLLAGPPQDAVAWEVPLACPDDRWLEARIEAYLGRPISPDDRSLARDRRFAGRIHAAGDGRFALELRTGDADRHLLEDHDCRKLGEVAASLLAITLDPLALGEPTIPLAQAEPGHHTRAVPIQRPARSQVSPAAPSPSPPNEPTPAEPTPTETPPNPWVLQPIDADPNDDPDTSGRQRRPRTGRLRGLLLADAGLALGLFPDPAPQVHGGLGLDRHRAGARLGLRVEIQGGALLAGRFRAGDGRSLGGDLRAWDLSLRPCLVPRWGRWDLRACAALGGGQLRGVGVGVRDPQPQTQPWLWAGADLGVAVTLRAPPDPGAGRPQRVVPALFLDLGAGVNALRPRFEILDPQGLPDVTYVVGVATGRARLGIELRFF